MFCNKIEGCSRPKQRFNILNVCLFAFCSTAGQGFKPNIGQPSPPPNPSQPLPYTPRVEVVLPLVKFNPAWVPHFLLTNRKDNKQESTIKVSTWCTVIKVYQARNGGEKKGKPENLAFLFDHPIFAPFVVKIHFKNNGIYRIC